MTRLASFSSNANVAVIGASGAIGTALCASLANDENVAAVHALSRSGATPSAPRIYSSPIDLFDENSIAEAAARVSESGPLDLVIVASGLLHQGDIQPEKMLRDLDAENMLAVLLVNTVGPTLVAKHFLPRMRRDGRSVFAALSARVGSTEDNRLGGWVSYRASKAALNMSLKTLAIEQARINSDAVIVTLHPGTVDSPLSKPFSSRVPPEQLFAPSTSASHLLKVIDALDPANSGGFFAWDGSQIPY